MFKTLYYTAATGWILSLIVHLLSIAGVDVAGKFPLVWALHIGIFVVWFPAILSLRKNEELRAFRQTGFLNRLSGIGMLKIIFTNTPTWMKTVAVAGFVYAFFNSLFVFMGQHYSVDAQNGQYILHNHGQFIKNITEQEYSAHKAVTIRGFSGIWIGFYGLAMAILYPLTKNQQSNSQ